MSDDSGLSKEQQVMRAMRLTLAAVIRDVTPPQGMKHPLSEQTIDDVRQCLALIAAREKELGEETGTESRARPRYIDEPSTTKVVSLDSLTSSRREPGE